MDTRDFSNIDVNEAIRIANQDSMLLKKFPAHLMLDRGFFMELLKQDGMALEFANALFQNDKELVLLAISKDPFAVQFASQLLKNDEEIAQKVVTNDGLAIKFMSPNIRANKEIAKLAVQNNYAALISVSEELKKDKTFMLNEIVPILKNKYQVGMENLSLRDLIEKRQILMYLPTYFSNIFKDSEKEIGDIDKIMDLYYNEGIYTRDFIKQLPDVIKKRMKIGSNINDIVSNLEYLYHAGNPNYEKTLSKLLIFIDKGFVPSSIVFQKTPNDKVHLFDRFKWFKLAKYKIFNGSNDAKVALVEFMFNMGLFLDDAKANKRNETILKLINHIPRDFNIEQLELMKTRGIDVSVFDKHYKRGKKIYYKMNTLSDDDLNIIQHLPNQVFDGSLKSRFINLNTGKVKTTLSTYDYEALLNQVNNYITKEWLDKVLTYQESDCYVLKTKPTLEEKEAIADCFASINNDNTLNISKITRMFNGTKMEFNEQFFNFFINNFADIIADEEYQLMMPKIINKYDEVSRYYEKRSGKVTLDSFRQYFKDYHYSNIPIGFEELADLCSKSGVNEDNFERLVELAREQKNRKKSIVPNIHVEVPYLNDEKIYGETTRLDDEIALVIGEEKFSNCCQALGQKGQMCMIHSATKESGRLFCTYDNNDRLLTQSWVWRNGDTICFDNIEQSNLYFDDKNHYRPYVMEVYKKAAVAFADASREKINAILSDEEKVLSSEELEKHRKLYEKTRVKHVTIGDTNYGVVTKDIFTERMPMPKRPLEYSENDYLDSDNQLIIYSEGGYSTRDTFTPEIYVDPRMIQQNKGKNIDIGILNKLKELNNKYDLIFDVSKLSKMYNVNVDDIQVIHGDDWYSIYSINNNELVIYDSMINENNIVARQELNEFIDKMDNIKIRYEQLSKDNISNRYR